MPYMPLFTTALSFISPGLDSLIVGLDAHDGKAGHGGPGDGASQPQRRLAVSGACARIIMMYLFLLRISCNNGHIM
jgi:hypothetical protein